MNNDEFDRYIVIYDKDKPVDKDNIYGSSNSFMKATNIRDKIESAQNNNNAVYDQMTGMYFQ